MVSRIRSAISAGGGEQAVLVADFDQAERAARPPARASASAASRSAAGRRRLAVPPGVFGVMAHGQANAVGVLAEQPQPGDAIGVAAASFSRKPIGGSRSRDSSPC